MKPTNNRPKQPDMSPSKVFDVAKPGVAAPNSTTRPLIVTHRPMVQDPMVHAAPKAEESTPEPPAEPTQATEPMPAQKIKLEPPEELAPETTDESAKDEAPETPTPSKPEETSEQDDTDERPSAKEEASQTAIDKKAAEADVQRQAEYEKIIESHKYFVPVNAVHHKRSMRYAVVGAILIILISLACIDVMLDAEVLDIPGIPHTDFIR